MLKKIKSIFESRLLKTWKSDKYFHYCILGPDLLIGAFKQGYNWHSVVFDDNKYAYKKAQSLEHAKRFAKTLYISYKNGNLKMVPLHYQMKDFLANVTEGSDEFMMGEAILDDTVKQRRKKFDKWYAEKLKSAGSGLAFVR